MTKTLAKRYLDLVNGQVDGHARWSIENARVSRPKEHADARVGTFCDRNLATAGLMTREGARDSAAKGRQSGGTARHQAESREIDERVVKLALETVNYRRSSCRRAFRPLPGLDRSEEDQTTANASRQGLDRPTNRWIDTDCRRSRGKNGRIR